MNDDPEGSRIGGHFMVGWTPQVEQLVAGVRIENFGQGGNIGECAGIRSVRIVSLLFVILT